MTTRPAILTDGGASPIIIPMSEPEIIPPTRATRIDDPLAAYKADVPAVVQDDVEGRRPTLAYEGGLTPREARFVTGYLTHGDGLRAMRDAGYEGASRALAKQLIAVPKIAALIEDQLDAIADLYRVTNARLVAEHARTAFSNLADFADVLTSDDPVEAFNALPRGVRSAVKKVRVRRSYEGKGEDRQPVDTLEIELHDKGRSLDTLGKITGLHNTEAEDEAITAFGEAIRAAARKAGLT